MMVFRDGALVEIPDISLADHSAAKRYAVEVGGVFVNGAPISTDRGSQAMISGAYTFAKDNPDAMISFKASSGFVSLSSAQMIAIGQAVASHVQACFAKEAEVAAQIANGTITTIAQINQAYSSLTT